MPHQTAARLDGEAHRRLLDNSLGLLAAMCVAAIFHPVYNAIRSDGYRLGVYVARALVCFGI